MHVVDIQEEEGAVNDEDGKHQAAPELPELESGLREGFDGVELHLPKEQMQREAEEQGGEHVDERRLRRPETQSKVHGQRQRRGNQKTRAFGEGEEIGTAAEGNGLAARLACRFGTVLRWRKLGWRLDRGCPRPLQRSPHAVDVH